MNLQMMVDRSRELLDERAAAEYLDTTPGTLAVWRSTGRYGIPFIKIGRNVRYRKSELDKWLDARTHMNGATGLGEVL